MPTYEYECRECRFRFELKRGFSEDGNVSCPRCGNEARRLFSPVPIIFKGPGFYVTDNRRDNQHSLNKEENDETRGEKEGEGQER